MFDYFLAHFLKPKRKRYLRQNIESCSIDEHNLTPLTKLG